MKVYSLYTPTEKIDFSKSLFEAISFSCINFAILYQPMVLINSNNYAQNHPVSYYIFLVGILFIAPILWPIFFSLITKIPFIRNKIIHPIGKPWDYLFNKKNCLWVLIHLKDGRIVGGRYGPESFASSYPHPEQIYLEELWKIDKRGRFLAKIEDSQGIIISSSEYESIEFFHDKGGK